MAKLSQKNHKLSFGPDYYGIFDNVMFSYSFIVTKAYEKTRTEIMKRLPGRIFRDRKSVGK